MAKRLLSHGQKTAFTGLKGHEKRSKRQKTGKGNRTISRHTHANN